MNYKGEDYYFIKNIKGDIIEVINSNGEQMAYFNYTAFGRSNTIENSFTREVPFRYRGYYFDI